MRDSWDNMFEEVPASFEARMKETLSALEEKPKIRRFRFGLQLRQGGGFPRGTAHGIHKQVARRAVQPGPALAGAKVLQCTNILPCAQEHFLHHILRGRITAAQPAAIGGQLRTVGAKQFFQHGFSFGSGRGSRPGFISSFYPR